MQQYRSKRATRTEFKAVKQTENENLRDYSRRVRYLGDLALSDKTHMEKDRDLRDQFLEGLYDSKLQQKLYEDETDRNFCEVLQRAQELEIIQKSSEQRREKSFKSDRIRYSQEDFELETVRAGFNTNNLIEEKFAALQTSMNTVASRLDRLDASIARTNESIAKTNENGREQTQILKDLPNAIAAAIVGAGGSAQSRGGGQPPQWQRQQPQPFRNPIGQTNSAGYGRSVHIATQPPPAEAECFKCNEIGHYARQCPKVKT